MKKLLQNTLLIFFGASLAACSSVQQLPYFGSNSESEYDQPTEKKVALVNEPIKNDAALGGKAALSMDRNDRIKLAHALDNAPGKSSQWVNENTGVRYVVTPTKKVTINGNPYCRIYEVLSTKSDRTQQTTGTACVAEDSSWQTM